jgi:hypothetical protein
VRRSIVLLFVVSVVTSGCHYVTACDLDYAAIFMRPTHAEVCDCTGLRHEAYAAQTEPQDQLPSIDR